MRDLLAQLIGPLRARRTVRNVGYNLAGQVLPMVAALVALPILTSHAGTSRLGFLGLAWALIGYFALLDLGLSRIVTRRFAIAARTGHTRHERRWLVRLAVTLFVVVTVAALLLAFTIPARWVVGGTATPELLGEAATALLILWATLPATVVTGLLRGTLEGLQQFGKVNVLRSTFGIWSFAAPLLVLPFSTTLPVLTLAIAAGRYLALVAHAIVVARALRANATGTPADPAIDSAAPMPSGDVLREGAWLSVSNLVGPVMVVFDRIAIAHLVSLAAAAWYFVPQEIALRLLVLPAAVTTTIFPMLARARHAPSSRSDGDRVAHDALLATAFASLPACIALGALAGPVLAIWMGREFAIASAPVAATIAVGLFANCCAQVSFAWIQAAGRADVTAKIHLAELPLYCVLLAFATWHYGIVGAAVVWSLRAVVDYALLLAAARRVFGESVLVSRDVVVESAAGIVVLAASGACRLLADPWWPTVVLAIAGIAIATRMGLRLYRRLGS